MVHKAHQLVINDMRALIMLNMDSDEWTLEHTQFTHLFDIISRNGAQSGVSSIDFSRKASSPSGEEHFDLTLTMDDGRQWYNLIKHHYATGTRTLAWDITGDWQEDEIPIIQDYRGVLISLWNTFGLSSFDISFN